MAFCFDRDAVLNAPNIIVAAVALSTITTNTLCLHLACHVSHKCEHSRHFFNSNPIFLAICSQVCRGWFRQHSCGATQQPRY